MPAAASAFCAFRRSAAALILAAALVPPSTVWGEDLRPLDLGSSAHLTLLGNEALVQGRWQTASDMYRRAIAADKSNVQAVFNLGLTHQQQGQWGEAKQWYDEVLRLSPGHGDALNNLGIVAYRTGDWSAAVARFTEAARAARETPVFAADSWFNAGTAHEQLRAWDEARRAYDEAIASDPRHVGAHFNLGTLLLGALAGQRGALDRARVHLARAVELQPSRSDAWINLGICDERRAAAGLVQPVPDPGAAFAKAIESATGAALRQALWARARFHARAQPPRRLAMRDDLRRILAGDPAFPDANGMLGSYHFSIGEFAQAAELLEREVAGTADDAASPGDLEAHYLLALLYTDHRVDPTRALAHATAYYRRDPDSPRIHDLRRRALRLNADAAGGAVPDTASPEHAPAPSERAPAPSEHAPASSEHASAPSEHAPASSEHAPASSEHAPKPPAGGADGHAPAGGGHAPAGHDPHHAH